MSLDPLPDESLPGYLVRLSYRIGISPGQLAVITGLIDDPSIRTPRRIPQRLPLALLYKLDPDQLAAFCHSTRLSPHEASALCISEIPVLRQPYSYGRLHTRRRLRKNWVLSSQPRYCPHCLAEAQQPLTDLGGAWRRHWYMPIVFACPTHNTLLSDTCPAEPSHNFFSSEQRSLGTLIMKAGDHRPHPTQCRQVTGLATVAPRTFSFCGHPLSTPLLPKPPSSQVTDLLRLQRGILRSISATTDSPAQVAGKPLTCQEYTSQLSRTASAVIMSWPLPRDLARSDILATALEEESSRRYNLDNGPLRDWLRPTEILPLAYAPTDALACAAALSIATDILNSAPTENRRLKERITDQAKTNTRHIAELINAKSRSPRGDPRRPTTHT